MEFIRKIVFAVCALWLSTLNGYSQCIVINEIMINPNGPYDGQNSPNTSEWIEFYNTCSTPVDISCYAFSDGDFTVVFPQGTIMQPYSYYVVGSQNSNVAINLNWATCNCTTASPADQVGIFGNSNEQVVLQNNLGVLQDAIVWGGGQAFTTLNTSTNGGCPQTSFSYSSSVINNTFENIGGAGGGDCSLARACDGSDTWVERCGNLATPGATNGGQVAPGFVAASEVLCTGSCTNFSYIGSGSPTQYTWTFSGSSTPTSSSPSPQNICYPTAGDYNVSLAVTGACGTLNLTIAGYIHVADELVITANGPTSFCDGGSVVLSTTSPGPYIWFLGTNIINGATSQTYTVTQPGTYSVSAGDGGCSPDGLSNAIEVTVSNGVTPVISANGSVNLCNDQTVDLSVNGGYATYQWYNGTNPISGANSSQYTASQSGSYSVFVTGQGCDGTSNTIQVNSTNVPVLATFPDFEVCQGQEISFAVSDVYDSYQWYNGTNPIAGATNASYTFNVTNTVEISLQVTVGGCSLTNDGGVVTSIPLPQITITPSNDVQVCQDSYTLTATSSANNYQWLNSGVPIAGATNATLVVTEDGDYSFTSTSATGNCTANSNEVNVILGTELEVEITATALEACEGQAITLSVNGNYDNITWSTNAMTSSITVNSSGLYIVTVNTNGCVATDEVNILFHAMPVANAGNDTISDCDHGVMLTGTGTGTLSWQADPTLTPSAGTAIALANPDKTTYYTLVATIGNCIATDIVMVEADCNSIYIPNVFTPNGDGINDVFEVQVRGAKHYHLRIFNRWGEMLFESTDPKKVWNGGKKDYYAPDGVYFWTLEAVDFQGKPMLDDGTGHGHVTLVR